MSSLDEIEQFKIWAVKMGCPLEKIPPDETLKNCIRGKQSILFRDIINKVRPRQEITAMRNNVLLNKLKQHKALGGVVAPSKLSRMLEELQRYEKIEKLKLKCSETKARILNAKSSLESTTEKIKEKNIQKVNLTSKLDEIRDKTSLYLAANDLLANVSEKEVEIKQKIEQSMPVQMSATTKTRSDAVDAIQQCLNHLEEFYSKFSELNQEGSKQAQQKLWMNMKIALKGIPNNLLWDTLMEMKEKQIYEISETDRLQTELEKDVTLSDHDLLQVNMAKLCGSHINLFIDLVAMKCSVQTMKDDYLAKYTPFSQMLETKMNLLNTMDDEADEILEDYMLQSTAKNYNQGQLEFITKEIDRRKQELKTQASKLENHEQLLGQLREIYGEIDSHSKGMQEEIQQLSQIKEKIAYYRRYTRYSVHNVRQKTTNQTMNLSEQSMNLTRLENSAQSNVAVFSPATLPPYSSELSLLAEIPIAKFHGYSKTVHFALHTQIGLLASNEANLLLSLLPNGFSSAEFSLQEMKHLIKFNELIKTFTEDVKPQLNTVTLDDDRYQQLWKANHEEICEQLDEIDAVSTNARQVIEKGRVYYHFVLANPLRKYVPPKKLFNGRNYREYENEYLMYYRMINGSMAGK